MWYRAGARSASDWEERGGGGSALDRELFGTVYQDMDTPVHSLDTMGTLQPCRGVVAAPMCLRQWEEAHVPVCLPPWHGARATDPILGSSSEVDMEDCGWFYGS